MKQIIKPILIFIGIQTACILEALLILSIYAGIHPLVTFSDILIPAIGFGLLLADVIAFWYFWKKNYFSKEGESWSFVSVRTILFTVIFTLFAIIVYDAILALIPMPEDSLDIFEALFTNWFAILSITVAGPIIEEILFRGIVLRRLLERQTPIKAILISSVIFGVIHGNPQQFIFAFLFGIPLGWMYYKTGSLVPSIIMHIMNNSIVTCVNILSPETDSFYEWFMGDLPIYLLLVVISLVICIASVFLLNKWSHFLWTFEKENTSDENIVLNEQNSL